ncbi:hypothetical protein [Syntrophomonas curvata]
MRFYQLLMLIGLVMLVILGLNTSNQGINNLTREERQAVLDVDYSKGNIKVEALGNSYSYALDRPETGWAGLKQQGRRAVNGFTDYLKKIWTIFDAVFLYE